MLEKKEKKSNNNMQSNMPLHTRAAHTSSASLSSSQPQNQQTAFSFVLSS